jgi:chromosomal replication initiation ATPase DnaA
LRRIGAYQKGDERILGDSAFVKKVLAQAKENFESKYHLKSNGFNFEKVIGRVAELLDLKPEQVLAVGKYKKTVAARSLLCFWATSELGISQSELTQVPLFFNPKNFFKTRIYSNIKKLCDSECFE